MKIEKKILPKSQVELILEEDSTKIEQYKSKAIENIRKNAKIKGFRPGAKIPDAVIVKEYGIDHINSIAIEYAIDNMYQEALRKEKLLPVAQAEINEVISQNPIKIRLTLEVFPTIEVKDSYKKIKLKKAKIEVSEKEVSEALSEIQTKFTNFKEADEKAKIEMGDRVTIDTNGVDKDGNSLDNTQMQDYPLVIGSKMLVPGFEDGLLWKKTGETVNLDITFPKDYHNTFFAGKETVFTVTIKKIEKSVKPEFTPEFIKDLRGKDLDLEGFKALIKEEIAETKEMNARLDEEHKLIDELKKITTLEIGDKMLENQIKNVFAEIKENLGRDNVRMQDYLESLKMTEEVYKEKNVAPIALRRLEWELILHKLKELENMEVSDADMNAEIDKILAKYGSDEVVKRLREIYVPGNRYYEEMKQRVGYRKLIDMFFE